MTQRLPEQTTQLKTEKQPNRKREEGRRRGLGVKWTVEVHSQKGAGGIEKVKKQNITLWSTHGEEESP